MGERECGVDPFDVFWVLYRWTECWVGARNKSHSIISMSLSFCLFSISVLAMSLSSCLSFSEALGGVAGG